ncbi:hypothetical protein CRG98_003956 [Punica granatum]|uniref:Secreted protein n=1 Tax=Punica granatum TaxID=22663 RepID=A0A2I0L6G3_PUNGR|nr:hypothetical protein CRG98_003956 [Punica granatum]
MPAFAILGLVVCLLPLIAPLAPLEGFCLFSLVHVSRPPGIDAWYSREHVDHLDELGFGPLINCNCLDSMLKKNSKEEF